MIYIHVPFCESFCTYCDFYSELTCKGTGIMESFEAYTTDICHEIVSRKDEIVATLEKNTLYIGGGTPSVLPLSCLHRIVSALREVVDSPFEEFTVEVNPEDITTLGETYVRGLLEMGVNRISMGVQSLDDGILRWMGRRHNASGALKAYEILRQAGCANISLDVIFGISGLADAVLEDTLDRITRLAPEHISAYQLSIEGGSALARMVEKGQYDEASDEQCRRQYGLICGSLRKAGYVHYEISNWALPEKQAIHNSAYWSRCPYVGLGPAAHSFSIDGEVQKRSWNSESLSGWRRESETLSVEEQKEEEIMLGLRTLNGWKGRVLTEDEWFVSDDIISDIALSMDSIQK